MKRSLSTLVLFAAAGIPAISHSECKKHVELIDSATLKSMVGKDAAVTLDPSQNPVVSIFDKVPASGKGKVVGHVAAGKSVLFLDKKEGAYQIELDDSASKAKVVGWADKKLFGKPLWLDTASMKACEAPGGPKKAGKGERHHDAKG